MRTCGINYKLPTSTQKFALLARADTSKGRWVYVQASAAITQYAFVQIDYTTGKAAMLTSTTAGGKPQGVGVAQAGFTINYYGWVWVGCGGGTGVGIKGLVAASYAAGAKMTTTATDGTVDDAACGNSAAPWRVLNVTGCSTDSGAGSAIELYAPGQLVADCNVPLNA